MICIVAPLRGEFEAVVFTPPPGGSGLLCMAAGGIPLPGSFAFRGSFKVHFSSAGGGESLHRRTPRNAREMPGSSYYRVLFVWMSGLKLLLSFLVHRSVQRFTASGSPTEGFIHPRAKNGFELSRPSSERRLS